MGSPGPLNVIVVWTGHRPGPWGLRALKAAGLESPAGVTVGREGPTGPWPSFPSIVKLRESAMGASDIEVVVVRDERERAAATGRCTPCAARTAGSRPFSAASTAPSRGQRACRP